MDYTKQCWSCGKLTMVPQNGYYQCSSCGATWDELPQGGEYIGIERHRGAMDGGLRYTPVRKRG